MSIARDITPISLGTKNDDVNVVVVIINFYNNIINYNNYYYINLFY